MTEKLTPLQRLINTVSQSYCPETAEKFTVPHGYNDEGTPTCFSCLEQGECPLVGRETTVFDANTPIFIQTVIDPDYDVEEYAV